METDKLFIVDLKNGCKGSYGDLLRLLNMEKVYFNPYCSENDLFKLFSNVVISMVYEEEITLLDHDYSDDEIQTMLGIGMDRVKEKVALKGKYTFKDHQELLDTIKRPAGGWRLNLLTSGTTGIPKKVGHSLETITRWVKEGDQFKNSAWGYAYNPTHMAGVQVFLQAFFNMNPIINLFGYGSKEIFDLITTYRITNISATPTWYKLLFPCDKTFPTVRHITMGGEKFDRKLADKVLKVFPEAKMHNIYASTEAGALFSSDGEVFKVKEEYSDKVKIRGGEIFIKREILGEANYCLDDGEWYGTGDMVNIINESPLTFVFKFRNNELIGMGGYKINPHEVEETLLSSGLVKDARVYGKKNSVTGNILCCDVVSLTGELKDNDIKKYLAAKLQRFKIPRIINFVDNIEITKTGKIKRA
jgi:acyl-coenzyme A synthetase/AMP-(fatty) acid ligase